MPQRSLFGINRYAAVVPHVLVCPRCKIENGCFSGVGVSNQCNTNNVVVFPAI